jgi:hypothetical protein
MKRGPLIVGLLILAVVDLFPQEKDNFFHDAYCLMTNDYGKYIFFESDGDVHWVDAKIIEGMGTKEMAAAPARAGDWKSRFSLKVGGGMGVLGWGDVETLKSSFHQQVRDAASAFAIETTGACENPRTGWQGEVELQFDLNPRIGFGLAVGRYSRSRETVLKADWPPFLTSQHTWSQASTIIPVTLSAYWRLPLGARSRAYIKAGAGLASAVWKYKIRDEETIDFLSWNEIEGTAGDKGLLVQAGLGYEIRIARRLAAFVEARGQILSLDGWNTDQENSTDVSSERISQKLWLVESAPSGQRPAQTLLIASAARPDGSLYNSARPARLNFSGGIFLVGIRLEL